jgi:hypothetical protein
MPVSRDAIFRSRSQLIVRRKPLPKRRRSDCFPANDRGVGAGSEADRDGGLEVVRRSESVTGNQSGLVRVALPVVVRRQKRAVLIEHPEPRVGQRIGDAELRQRRTKSANRNPGRADFVAGDESANEHIGTGSDKGASANVRQPRIGRLIKVVDLCQTNAGASVFACQDRGIISGGQDRDQRRFLVVGRRDTGIGNFCLLRLFPIEREPVIEKKCRGFIDYY